jgi:hypothetical protein
MTTQITKSGNCRLEDTRQIPLTIFYDDFNDSIIDSKWEQYPGVGSISESSGRLTLSKPGGPNATFPNGPYVLVDLPTSTDWVITFNKDNLSGNVHTDYGLLLYQDTDNAYIFGHNFGGGGGTESILKKKVSGSWTTIKQGWSMMHNYRIRKKGTNYYFEVKDDWFYAGYKNWTVYDTVSSMDISPTKIGLVLNQYSVSINSATQSFNDFREEEGNPFDGNAKLKLVVETQKEPILETNWWKINEGSGDTIIDYSGSSTGTRSGTTTWTTGLSPYANCLDFAGGRVTVGNNSALFNSTKASVSVWIKPDTLDSRAIIGNKNNGDYAAGTVILNTWTSSGNFRIWFTTGYGLGYVGQVSAPFIAGQVYHVLVSMDNTQAVSTDKVKCYINGIEKTVTVVQWDGTTGAVIGNPSLTNNYTIGVEQPNGTRPWDGLIGDLRIVKNEILTLSDAQELYNSGIGFTGGVGGYSGNARLNDTNKQITKTGNASLAFRRKVGEYIETGYKNPVDASQIVPGDDTWNNIANIKLDDGVYADATNPIWPSERVTYNLAGSNYSFNIPADGSIYGIQVRIDKKASWTGVLWTTDELVDLRWDNQQHAGDNKALSGQWPTSETKFEYGGVRDLWNTSPTPAVVNNSNFGAFIKARNKSVGGVTQTAYIDVIQMNIVYSAPFKSNATLLKNDITTTLYGNARLIKETQTTNDGNARLIKNNEQITKEGNARLVKENQTTNSGNARLTSIRRRFGHNINDPGFENRTTGGEQGWQLSSGAAFTTEDKHSGTYSVKLNGGMVQQNIGNFGHGGFRCSEFSFWAKGDGAVIWELGYITGSPFDSDAIFLTGTWTKYTIYPSAPDKQIYYFDVGEFFGSANYVDDFDLVSSLDENSLFLGNANLVKQITKSGNARLIKEDKKVEGLIFSDDFSDGIVNPAWTQQPGLGTISEYDGKMHLKVDELADNMDEATLLYKPIENTIQDYSFSAKITKSPVANDNVYYGLILKLSNNYLMWGKYSFGVSVISFYGIIEDDVLIDADFVSGVHNYYKIAYENSVYKLLYSYDGINWSNFKDVTLPFTPSYNGIFGAGASSIPAEFDCEFDGGTFITYQSGLEGTSRLIDEIQITKDGNANLYFHHQITNTGNARLINEFEGGVTGNSRLIDTKKVYSQILINTTDSHNIYLNNSTSRTSDSNTANSCEITPNVNCSVISVTKQSNSDATVGAIGLNGYSQIASAPFIDNVATFSTPVPITVGTTYYVGAGNNGGPQNSIRYTLGPGAKPRVNITYTGSGYFRGFSGNWWCQIISVTTRALSSVEGLYSKSRLVKTTEITKFGNANLYFHHQIIKDGNARIGKYRNITLDGNARLLDEIQSNNNGNARVTLTSETTLDGDVRLLDIKQSNLNGNAFIYWEFEGEINGTARLIFTSGVNKSGNARLIKENIEITKDSNARVLKELVELTKTGTAGLFYQRKILINSVEYVSKVVNARWTDPLNEEPEAILQIREIDPTNTDVQINKEVEIWEHNELKYYGVIRRVAYVDNNSAKVTSKGWITTLKDRKYYNSGTYTKTWSATRTNNVMTDVLGAQSTLSSGTLYNNGTNFNFKNENETLYDSVKKLVKWGLGDFEVVKT